MLILISPFFLKIKKQQKTTNLATHTPHCPHIVLVEFEKTKLDNHTTLLYHKYMIQSLSPRQLKPTNFAIYIPYQPTAQK